MIPAYNAEVHVAQSIESVMAQTVLPADIVVVDDGSTDRTAEIAGRYGAPVRCIRQSQVGPAGARNRGINETKEELIAFLDADDLWHAEKLERQVAALDGDPEAGYAITMLLHFWDPERQAEASDPAFAAFREPILGYQLSTVLARRHLFEAHGLFDGRAAEDSDWFFRMREQGVRTRLIPEVLTYRRFHGNNLTRKGGRTDYRNLVESLKHSLDRRRAR